MAMVGRLLGVPALGFHQMAWRVASPPPDVTQFISTGTVAAYAKLQDSRQIESGGKSRDSRRAWPFCNHGPGHFFGSGLGGMRRS